MRSLEPYITRLYDEWMAHGKIIIACDYDDTLSPWKLATHKECLEVIQRIRLARETGAYIVIHTACSPDRYESIKVYLASMGLEIDSINENPIDLPYGNHKKVYANIFIDDRAGLNEALEILEVAMYRKRGENFKASITEQNSP